MLKQREKKIGNINLITTFVVLMIVAFLVVLLSVNSKLDRFENLEKQIKVKFLEDKKNDIRFTLQNINLLMESKEAVNNKPFIREYIEKINENKLYVISIAELSKDMDFYSEIVKTGEFFKYTLDVDGKNISKIEYFILNKDFNWVIQTSFNDDIINKEIASWEEHLHELILDNIYVHISLLFLFTIALLLVVYIINNLAKKAIEKCKNSIKKREESFKYKLNKLQTELSKENKKYKKQTALIQKQSKMLALGEMLGNLSHQWRQPLSEISKTAQEIQDKMKKNKIIVEDDIEKLTHINNSALYLSRTVDDFRVFLKADSLKIDFVASEIIEKALTINKSIIEKNNIKIIKEIDEDIMLHNLSFGLLQALVNIIYNAKDVLKNVEEKDRLLFIQSKNYDDRVEINITDTGNGISEDIIDNIFKPYFTTKKKTYGTGLGLHMAYNIIEQNMSGTITVQNKKIDHKKESYKGASFTITLFLKEK